MRKTFPICYAISPRPVLVMDGTIARVKIREMKILTRDMKRRIRVIENAIKRLETAVRHEERQSARPKARKGGEA